MAILFSLLDNTKGTAAQSLSVMCSVGIILKCIQDCRSQCCRYMPARTSLYYYRL